MPRMLSAASLAALAVLAPCAGRGNAQYVIVPARPAVSYYYAPPPAVSYYTPSASYYAPSVSYYAPRASYYAPSVSYYAPSVSYYAPSVSYYAPAAPVYVAPPAPVYAAPTTTVITYNPYRILPRNRVSVSTYYTAPPAVAYGPVYYR